MDTNIGRLLREGLQAHFSALLRLLIIILGKSPSCSSCSYTVRLTAGSLSVPLALVQDVYTFCLGKLNLGISLVLVLEWARLVLPIPICPKHRNKSLDYIKTYQSGQSFPSGAPAWSRVHAYMTNSSSFQNRLKSAPPHLCKRAPLVQVPHQ